MGRRPWFGPNRGGGWFVPVTPQGWGIVVLFILAVIGTAWLPVNVVKAARIGCGLAYLAISYGFSSNRVSGDAP